MENRKADLRVLLCLMAAFHVCWMKQEPKQVRVDSAFTIKNVLYMIADREVLYLVHNEEFLRYGSSHFDIPSDMTVQAAYGTHEEIEKIMFYGDAYGLFGAFYEDPFRTKRLNYGQTRAFLQNGGPDAAAKRKDAGVLMFKGCQVVIRHTWYHWGNPIDLETIGLPCIVDAAWRQGDEIIILKGNQIWRWQDGGSITGPELFHDNYKVTSWILMPVPDGEGDEVGEGVEVSEGDEIDEGVEGVGQDA